MEKKPKQPKPNACGGVLAWGGWEPGSTHRKRFPVRLMRGPRRCHIHNPSPATQMVTNCRACEPSPRLPPPPQVREGVSQLLQTGVWRPRSRRGQRAQPDRSPQSGSQFRSPPGSRGSPHPALSLRLPPVHPPARDLDRMLRGPGPGRPQTLWVIPISVDDGHTCRLHPE